MCSEYIECWCFCTGAPVATIMFIHDNTLRIAQLEIGYIYVDLFCDT